MKKEIMGFKIHPDVVETKLTMVGCLRKYHGKKFSKDFYIYAERLYGLDFEATRTAPALYHIFDFTADKNLRGIHMTVETFPWIKEDYSSKAIKIKLNNHYGLSMLDKIIHNHCPETLARLILIVERRFIAPNEHEGPLFSRRSNGEFYKHVLIYELDKVLNK